MNKYQEAFTRIRKAAACGIGSGDYEIMDSIGYSEEMNQHFKDVETLKEAITEQTQWRDIARLSYECIGAMQCLSVHNEWRRGERDDQDSPKAIGEAIDIAIKAMDAVITAHVKAAIKQNKRRPKGVSCKQQKEIR